MWLDKVSIPRKLTLAFAITLASFATSSGIIYNTMLLDEQIGLQSRMTNDQELESTNAAAALMDMSQSARGYLLTNVERHKGLYEAASLHFNESMSKAIELTAKTNSTEASTALKNMQAAGRQWQSEIGDPIIRLTAR